MEKYQLVAHLNIPYRDLRILDPLAPIPYPTTIFIREKALVVNLESIRMIICQDQASLQCCCLSTCQDQAMALPVTARMRQDVPAQSVAGAPGKAARNTLNSDACKEDDTPCDCCDGCSNQGHPSFRRSSRLPGLGKLLGE